MLSLRFLGEDGTLAAQEGKEGGLLLLPGDVADDWNQVVANIVKDRVAAVPKMAQIEIFCSLEGRKQTDEFLTSIIMTEAAKALDELVLNPVSYATCIVLCYQCEHCKHVSVCRKHTTTQEVLNNFSYLDRVGWWHCLEIF